MKEIIDAHAHIYPAKIADKASIAIGSFYSINMNYHGDTSTLLEEGKRAGVSRFVVHSVATTTHQVHSINEFILSEMNAHPEFIGFMTLHPDMCYAEIEEEINWGIANGFKGIKLHPDFQKFEIDEDRARNIYELAKGKLPILFHTGDKRYNFSKPEKASRIAKEYPDLTLICAHFGGYSVWDEVGCYEGLTNVYFDTSSSLFEMSAEKAKELIERFGYEKFFFATDYPMWDATEELERFMKIDLTEEQREAILSKNLKKLLKID